MSLSMDQAREIVRLAIRYGAAIRVGTDDSDAFEVMRGYIYSLAAGQLNPASPPIPSGWRLLKDSTREERDWPGDATHENGQYFSTCVHCGREFTGRKRRIECRSCCDNPSPKPAEPQRAPLTEAQVKASWEQQNVTTNPFCTPLKPWSRAMRAAEKLHGITQEGEQC